MFLLPLMAFAGHASIRLLPIDALDMSADGRVFVGSLTLGNGGPASWSEATGTRLLLPSVSEGFADRVSSDGRVILFWKEKPGPEWLYVKRGNAAPQHLGKHVFSFNPSFRVCLAPSGEVVMAVTGPQSASWFTNLTNIDRFVKLALPPKAISANPSVTRDGNMFYGTVMFGSIKDGNLTGRAAKWTKSGHLTLLASPGQLSSVGCSNQDGSLLGGMIGDLGVVWAGKNLVIRIQPAGKDESSSVDAIRSIREPIYGSTMSLSTAASQAWVRLPSRKLISLSEFLRAQGLPVAGRVFDRVMRMSRDGKILLVHGTENGKPAYWRVTLP